MLVLIWCKSTHFSRSYARKIFKLCRPLWPLPLKFSYQHYLTIYSVRSNFPIKYALFTEFQLWVKERYVTHRQTDKYRKNYVFMLVKCSLGLFDLGCESFWSCLEINPLFTKILAKTIFPSQWPRPLTSDYHICFPSRLWIRVSTKFKVSIQLFDFSESKVRDDRWTDGRGSTFNAA